MSAVVIELVLFAATLHATWNAVLRSGADRLWSVTIMSFATTVAAIPFALVLPPPMRACWPYLGTSALLQVGYSVFLAYAYRYGELGQVYPVVRGCVPLLVTIGGFFLAGQKLSASALLGIALVSAGIISLASGKGRAAPKSTALALTTSLFIASYVTTDAIGVRLAGDPRAYAAWIFLIYGALMPLVYLALRGELRLQPRSPETHKAIAGGLISLLSYSAIISALALGPVGPISALREVSVVFSAVIGRLILREPLTARRIAACLAVTIGAACLVTS